ncbi:hypothetical protein JMN32_06845 [Fulvivirga sp. 29W222]|uniref:Uncharacterized protein n=1 Tax=Fulvivirga marina TaxID=2494733 RepID=A0A937FUB7_9BACT|nr:hypothetical protein [Fulvivirga marina]MBL6446019.1 hypothetical protein [Fulvivirga marina]
MVKEDLWNNIRQFEIDDPESGFSFTDRLIRENGWKRDYAIRAVYEYKKFMYLICIADHPLTPSDQVDQVWHLHLLYTESYWIDFCQNTLLRNVHHGPTKGGNEEKQKFGNWYEKTMELYALVFGSVPPADIWPPGKIRFAEINFTRVNRHRNWVIPKLSLFKKWKS